METSPCGFCIAPTQHAGYGTGFQKHMCHKENVVCVYIYIIEYYSAITRDEIESFVVMWMNLESVIQSEVSQKEENK